MYRNSIPQFMWISNCNVPVLHNTFHDVDKFATGKCAIQTSHFWILLNENSRYGSDSTSPRVKRNDKTLNNS